MKLREVKGPIKHQNEGSPWRYITTTLRDHTVQHGAYNLKMLLIKANAVKYTLLNVLLPWEDKQSYQAKQRSMNHRVNTRLAT